MQKSRENTVKTGLADIKRALLEQLRGKGMNASHYASLVDDYCFFEKQERAMQKDIREKGRTYEAVSAAGKDYEKNNPSVKDALLYNKHKLEILQALGLTTDVMPPEDDPDEAGM